MRTSRRRNDAGYEPITAGAQSRSWGVGEFMGRLKSTVSLAAGAVADVAAPHLGDEIDARTNAQTAKLKRVILQARMRRQAATVQDNYDRLLHIRAQAIEGSDRFVLNSELGFTRMVEIGCGDGRLLDSCAERLPSPPPPQRRRR